jgi:hypothetical protein
MDVPQEMMRSTTRSTQFAKMSLEELLYYVLASEGRGVKAPAQP